MSRTIEQVIQEQLGGMMFQLACLRVENEQLVDKNKELENKLASLDQGSNVRIPDNK